MGDKTKEVNDTEIMEMLTLAFWFVVAAGIAALLRLKDFPSLELTKENIKTIALTFVGALIAVIIGWKLLAIQLLVDGVMQVDALILIITIAIGGMTSVRAILGKWSALAKVLDFGEGEKPEDKGEGNEE